LLVGGSSWCIRTSPAMLRRTRCRILVPRRQRVLGQVRVPAYAFPQDHHTGAVAGGIEGQVHSKHTAAEGIRDQRQPRSSQSVAGARTNELHIELGVVDMCDFEGTIT